MVKFLALGLLLATPILALFTPEIESRAILHASIGDDKVKLGEKTFILRDATVSNAYVPLTAEMMKAGFWHFYQLHYNQFGYTKRGSGHRDRFIHEDKFHLCLKDHYIVHNYVNGIDATAATDYPVYKTVEGAPLRITIWNNGKEETQASNNLSKDHVQFSINEVLCKGDSILSIKDTAYKTLLKHLPVDGIKINPVVVVREGDNASQLSCENCMEKLEEEQDKISDLEQELKDALERAKLAEHETKLEQDKNSNLEKQLKEALERAKLCETDLETCNLNAGLDDPALTECQQNLKDMGDKNAELQNAANSCETDLETCNLNVGVVDPALTECQDKLNKMVAKNTELIDTGNECQDKLNKMVAKNTELIDTVNDMYSDSDSMAMNLVNTNRLLGMCNAQLADAQNEVKECKDRGIEVESNLRDCYQKSTIKSNDIVNLRNALKDANTQTKECQEREDKCVEDFEMCKSVNADLISELESSLADCQRESNTKSNDLNNLRNQLIKYMTDLKLSKDGANALNTQYTDLVNQFNNLQVELENCGIENCGNKTPCQLTNARFSDGQFHDSGGWNLPASKAIDGVKTYTESQKYSSFAHSHNSHSNNYITFDIKKGESKVHRVDVYIRTDNNGPYYATSRVHVESDKTGSRVQCAPSIDLSNQNHIYFQLGLQGKPITWICPEGTVGSKVIFGADYYVVLSEIEVFSEYEN